MKIKNIHISEVIYVQDNPDDWVLSFLEDGPFFSINCIINNNTDTIITLKLGEDTFYDAVFFYQFNYRGKTYNSPLSEMFPIYSGVIKGDTIKYLPKRVELLPADSIEITSFTYLLSWNLADGRLDYTRMLFEILPTLQVIYDDSHTKIRAIEKMSVSVDWYYKKNK